MGTGFRFRFHSTLADVSVNRFHRLAGLAFGIIKVSIALVGALGAARPPVTRAAVAAERARSDLYSGSRVIGYANIAAVGRKIQGDISSAVGCQSVRSLNLPSPRSLLKFRGSTGWRSTAAVSIADRLQLSPASYRPNRARHLKVSIEGITLLIGRTGPMEEASMARFRGEPTRLRGSLQSSS